MAITLEQIGVASPSAVDVISVDLTSELDSTETISSISSVTEVTTTALTLASSAVKSSSWTHKDGHTVSANKGVQVGVTVGASADGTYRIRWTVVTSSSRTLVFDTLLVAT